MANPSKRWIDGLQFSSLFWPPPQDPQERKVQITAYVEYFGQFTSEQFPEDIAELIRSRYPSKEQRLFDDVLATFVLHHPEHGHAVVLPIISGIIDGSLVYDKSSLPFASFISLVCPSSENEYSEQWALACGEILRILTHYNRPIYKMEPQNNETDRSHSSSQATTSESVDGEPSFQIPLMQQERKPLRPLSPWITDILLAAPLGIRSDYFRWETGIISRKVCFFFCDSKSTDVQNRCSGVMGKYAAGDLKPPTTVHIYATKIINKNKNYKCDYSILPIKIQFHNLVLNASSRGSGKHPQLMPSTPRWAVANGAGVILSVCDEEVARYETASLTAAAVPALLLPPPTTALDEHLVAGLPALEPYARLFHRYYAIATPSATQRLLLGLLEAPPSWAPDALDAAVQLVELLRAAEDYATGIRLPRNWMHLHFFAGNWDCNVYEGRKQIEVPAAEATIEATAQGIASMLCAHGPEVEWRICTIWEAAYGLIPLSSSAVDLPEIIVSTPLQPPILSWNLYIPLLKVLEYLPRGSPSEACLMKIFVATVEAILQRTFPPESPREQTRKTRYSIGSASKNLAVAELRTMVHSLFLESCASIELASRLLFVVLTVCVSHEAQFSGSKRPRGEESYPSDEGIEDCSPLVTRGNTHSTAKDVQAMANPAKVNGSSIEYGHGIDSAIHHTHRILAILEALFSLKPSSVGTSWGYSSNEIVAAAMVAAHISELFRRSKACMYALSVLMRCKWDNEIYTRASSLYNLIDIHSKAVASIVNKAEPLEAQLIYAPVRKYSPCLDDRKQNKCSSATCFDPGQSSASECEDSTCSDNNLRSEKLLASDEGLGNSLGKGIAGFPLDASDLANFLTRDRHIGFNCSAQILLRSVLVEKQELCFSVVSLLWHKLIAAPETQPSAESTSAQQGWRQVVDALCNVVSASPTKATTAVVLQADRELQPWIAKDDDQGQKMWRINQRIVKLIVELMRNHDSAESLVIVASASDLLLRATDGMLVDGEACTLPQLELLEATARAVQPVLEWGESGLAVADGLSNLLKCRLPATTRCLSHPSAHVRALSTSVLRNILHIGSINSKSKVEIYGIRGPSYQFFNIGAINWQNDIEKCLTWEVYSQLARGMTIQFLDTAAKELGCNISI
ncbi:hypothetical protein GOBAR_DD15581 [Gossypium barbadense]|nr:hypothetical protein GOBAR_DD15581 [Gossypium barbadense]